jgi:hypothetical protein
VSLDLTPSHRRLLAELSVEDKTYPDEDPRLAVYVGLLARDLVWAMTSYGQTKVGITHLGELALEQTKQQEHP